MIASQKQRAAPVSLFCNFPNLPFNGFKIRAFHSGYKDALTYPLKRDPVDAAVDSEILARLLDRRRREIFARTIM
jgi:hypothetical protein